MSCGAREHLHHVLTLHDPSPRQSSLFNVIAETRYQHDSRRLPTIQPASPNKGASSQTSKVSATNRPVVTILSRSKPHANIIASSNSSTTETTSESTSSSSRDSLPVAQIRSAPTTPQKEPRNDKRNKSSKSNARWNSRRGSSDDTGSNRKPFPSQPSDASPNPVRTPQRQRQPQSANKNPPAKQGQLMATAFGSPSGDSRRGVASPRPKGRGKKSPGGRASASDRVAQKLKTLSAAMLPSMDTAGTKTVSARYCKYRTSCDILQPVHTSMITPKWVRMRMQRNGLMSTRPPSHLCKQHQMDP